MAEEPAQKSKRRVRNPETFRERALKAADDSAKPKKAKRAAPALRKTTLAIGRPFRVLGRNKAVRLLLKPLRLLGKILVPSYFRGSVQELRQVKWPSRRESRQLTFAVLIFAVIFGATIAVVDYGLDKLFRNILLK